MKNHRAWTICLLAAMTCGCGGGSDLSLTNDPAVPTAGAAPDADADSDVPKGDSFYVVFDTSEGDFLVAVHPGWAPLGAERFRDLVDKKYYDDCRFFRVLDGFMAQVGINGDPAITAQWHENAIPDDPVKVSNRRRRVTYAMAGPNSRTTQIFINFGDNRRLDSDGFAPFGEVIAGMETVEKLYKEYGDCAPYGSGPNQTQITARGNDYLQSEFPELDYIVTARLYDTLEAAETAMAAQSGAGEANPAEPPSAAETSPAESPAAEATSDEPPAATDPASADESPAAEPAATETPAGEAKSDS